MKHKFTQIKVMLRPGRFGSVLTALLLLGLTASSALGQVLPPSSLTFEKNLLTAGAVGNDQSHNHK